MVEYQCNKCTKTFTKKYNYMKHNERKTPCSILNNNFRITKKHKCKNCNKKINRKDNYKRHIEKCKKNISIKKYNVNSGSNYGQIINGNNNNIIIKNYNLLPFGRDGIECLTTPEKIAIFSSDENPMEMIIIKVNLDPLKINHHNVGYTDEHSGFDIIFDGDEWLTERIEVILEILFESKENHSCISIFFIFIFFNLDYFNNLRLKNMKIKKWIYLNDFPLKYIFYHINMD